MSDLTVDTPVQPRSNAGRQKPLNGVNLVRFKKITQVGIKSIFSHGLRSMLTVLGIVIGVAAVIAMLAVSEGASYEAQQQFRDLGASNILLKSVKPAEVEENSRQGFGPPQAVVYGLTNADITTIRDTIPGVSNVISSRIVKKNVWNLGINTNTDVVGTTVDYPVSRNYNLRAGRFFSQAEVRDHANVVVLSDEVANALFPIDNPIGQSIKIDSDYYNVVGIMESEGFSNLGQSQAGSSNAAPSRIFIPFTASKSRFGETTMRQTAGGMESETVELHEAIIQIEGQESVIEVGEIIEQILQRRHKEVDYEIEVPLALLRQAEESALRDQIVAGAIAGISLLVGGIGIMNIMLASVTERTREIGIRRAMGAKKRDIITQFLVEAVILSGVGGVIGVVLGVVIPIIISIFWGMTTIVTPIAPILAFSISAMIGVIFGIYPSMRAADMDPVEALRHE
ncbi:MAG: ABC transporter ATP-binding protein [Gammaproteobacteria bacterium]|jgi:putative ABC transport system permease protein|nr:ABC transporter ATP-binding protein [Gammaproteobacteria bacterium]MCH2577514.1 ABC transporter permease [Pseudomonadales bacterium]MEC8950451.1 ABC transporter permease [Pseudomonadota bacterium]MBI91509.1 ABC transporter ATP-binding protein [Gammaproteobacteria bacterium]MEC9301224.1 ABC transporter permease [Pseudomonadota bacterium]|tara:strand:- start:3995 stop:5356 length:1362 start_codon:yes stop_codon:yes gene_type:complete